MNVDLFISIKLGFSFHCELPTYTSFCLLEVSENIISISNHLLDWLHWKDRFTQSAMLEEGKKVEECANVLPLAHEEETIQFYCCLDFSTHYQDMSFAHYFQDPFSSLLQSSDHDGYLVFNHGLQLQLYIELPIFKFFFRSYK